MPRRTADPSSLGLAVQRFLRSPLGSWPSDEKRDTVSTLPFTKLMRGDKVVTSLEDILMGFWVLGALNNVSSRFLTIKVSILDEPITEEACSKSAEKFCHAGRSDVPHQKRKQISSIFPCETAEFPCTYLGFIDII